MSSREHLYSVYQRIKKDKAGCYSKWLKDSDRFYSWYEEQSKKQKGQCHYCELPGDTCKYYGTSFREGKRGIHLEIDRKDNNESYSPTNCVLACYPCNNAKSDVFTYDEFREIAKTIAKVKKRSKQ